jgi:hypothetical protein
MLFAVDRLWLLMAKIGVSGQGYEITKEQRKRFFQKITKDGDCWIWTSNAVPVPEGDGQGYPLFRLDGKTQLYAHRVSWMLHFGDIPLKAKIRRTCGKNLCVNPQHLYMFYQRAFEPRTTLKREITYEVPQWLKERAEKT